MGSPFLFFTVLSWLLNLLMLAIFVRVLLSWINQDYSNPLVRIVWDVTEPVLAPIRRVLPSVGMFDFSPIIAIILLYVLRTLIVNLIHG
jgi:YggT family protein